MRSARWALILLLAGCRHAAPPVPEGEDMESPPTQETSGRSGEDRDPELSPDGKLLYYASSSFGSSFDLFVREIGSNTAARLTRLAGDERFPKVNPADPRYLAFSTNTRGAWEVAILDTTGDPDRIEVVSESGAHSIHPSWSPDGRMLVYSASDAEEGGEWTLKVFDFAGRRTRLLGVEGLLPEWAPRGNRIAFQQMKRRDGWYGALWTLELEEGRVRDLRAVFSSDEWAAINPSWSPDGRRLVFATVAKSRARAGVLHEGDDLWAVNADGSGATRLTSHPAADWMPTWAGDGRVYFVSKRSGSDRIWSLLPHLPPMP